MGLAIIQNEKSLKKMGLKKPILVVIKGNEFIKVASFNNVEMLNLFIEALKDYGIIVNETEVYEDRLNELPPIQPKKEIAKRVLWTGWKGYRDTRYKCPNCKKPVKNDDIYCHRCGQKLMFPHISFTDYVPGEKQETIVRWDDE